VIEENGRIAFGTARGHAGEILQGALRHGDGIHRFLCSLPAPTLGSQATLVSTPGRPLSIDPPWALKSLAAARLLLDRLGARRLEFAICLDSNVPVAKGCGSSTADVVATMRVLLSHFGVSLSGTALARLTVEAEGASDGSVLGFPAVFRHREGIIEDTLPGEFPAMRVIVVDSQPNVTVPTLSMRRARYSARQIDAFQALLSDLRHAFGDADPAGVGAVATASARINQEFLPKPHVEDVIAMVEREGGYGVAAAHSGTVLSLLLPAFSPLAQRTRLIAGLAELGMPVVTEFAHSRTIPSGDLIFWAGCSERSLTGKTV
jgi:uncharacterized protein involved in propanediol utilization